MIAMCGQWILEGDFVGAGGLRLDQTMKQTSEVWGLGNLGELSGGSREKSHGEAQKRPAI